MGCRSLRRREKPSTPTADLQQVALGLGRVMAHLNASSGGTEGFSYGTSSEKKEAKEKWPQPRLSLSSKCCNYMPQKLKSSYGI